MISDLLDYAGITFGKVRLVIETVDRTQVPCARRSRA